MSYQDNMLRPYKISQIDLSKLLYSKPKPSKNGDRIKRKIKYNDKGKNRDLVFQTPSLFNLTKPKILDGYAEIELALEGKEENRVDQFIDFIHDLEKKVKMDAQKNASDWFKLDNNDVINFKNTIRESSEYNKGTIRLKIIRNKEFETVLQLNNEDDIAMEQIPSNSWSKLILEVHHIWIKNNNDFGIFLLPHLASFTIKKTSNYRFVEDSDENDDIDIPETETNNIFIPFYSKKARELNDSTSQLDFNINKNVDDFNINKNVDSDKGNQDAYIDTVLSLNINPSHFSSSSSEKEEIHTETTIDKETSIIEDEINKAYIEDSDEEDDDDVDKILSSHMSEMNTHSEKNTSEESTSEESTSEESTSDESTSDESNIQINPSMNNYLEESVYLDAETSDD